MIQYIEYGILAIVGYLLGSISVAIILSKLLFKKDVRDSGSGNAGATNVARTFGLGIGIATLVGDIVKTVVSSILGYQLMGLPGMYFALFGCFFGHCFPVYFKFKGGKGVAVGCTLALICDWKAALIGVVLFIIVVIITKRVSVGSIAAAIGIPISHVIINGINHSIFPLFVICGSMIVFMHRENIKRLIKGTEPVFKLRK
ncbi:MAG: glycerol-3-phosphate 1-O-acyltransferase PlsY [Clostridia bacterium]|nr:glycerol-3-phosphate 1-O-acyltransferase PlsY [Clostridia bacterium]